MPSIDVLTVSGEFDEAHAIKVVSEAKDYFPYGTWDRIRYLGKIALSHDVKILLQKVATPAYIFKKLINQLKNIHISEQVANLLLGITEDPIVTLHWYFDGQTFKRELHLIHDYVSDNLGVISLYNIEDEVSNRVVAHGLGHNQGLRHHAKPVDLMHSNLLRIPRLQVDGFCEDCMGKLQA